MLRFCLFLILLSPAFATASDADFFEKKIRPALVQHCYKCHAGDAKAPKAGLRVDSRAALLAGGESGPAIIPGDTTKGTLLEAIRYTNPDMMMPPAGKLPAHLLKDLETWIKAGAVWPGDDGATTIAKPEFDIESRKAAHWCWKPLTHPAVPALNPQPREPIDAFLLQSLRDKKLSFAAPAEREVWLRRATFALTGLPPTVEERTNFLADRSTEFQAKSTVIDRLLNSPHYGERWGRHWLDLVRYAESRGHEFDYDIPNIYHYRDYVVRALNADVPYDQFVLEHLAGDCLPQARLSPTGGNESILGTAHWHLGEEVHSPIDIRQDQADRFDNRIDVFSKAFLGLTLSCARCHDHKFDAVSAKDYYSMFTLLEGSQFRQVRFDTVEQDHTTAKKLHALYATFTTASSNAEPLALPTGSRLIVDYSEYVPTGHEQNGSVFRHVRPGGASFSERDGKRFQQNEPRGCFVYDRFWDKQKAAAEQQQDGNALNKHPRAGRTLRTPEFTLEKKTVYLLVRGQGVAYANICGHSVIAGPLHQSLVKDFSAGDSWTWIAMNLAEYQGRRFHVELTPAKGSHFAIAAVVQADEEPRKPTATITPIEMKPDAAQALRDAEAELAVGHVWVSRIAPVLWDGEARTDHVFLRGNPKTLGDSVGPRGVQALFGTTNLAPKQGSGRLELATQLLDAVRNPLLDRVIVNRLWHHLFGRGIVASTDNFGVLGEVPSHPELLDYLATEFIQSGRKIKPFLKRLMLSDAYGQSSLAQFHQADPTNALLHSFRLKALEGEAIRDAMLLSTDTLDRTVGGRSVPIHLTPFLDGRGKPASGPVDGNNRRSLYLSVRRNFMAPFLQTFDTPTPFSTVGKRQTSNVPAQALTLMNDPFVHLKAEQWGTKLHASKAEASAKVTSMYVAAFGREPTADESATIIAFLGTTPDVRKWTDVAHALFQAKEFRFVW